ncbi:hypothetical protein DPEC_G00080090 [Dallia pectoralis]|uniref:Uncharacterized protein n=1 Tax=Dallia pectoralis TaxID=75939 RepID=A0ACC2H5T6_DALPE|nr:hypothetical protein DPEC_G00080090 [Dallia pectoralis]
MTLVLSNVMMQYVAHRRPAQNKQLWTAHARTKGDAAEQAALAASQDADIARAVAMELSPSFHQPGPDYIKQAFMEPVDLPNEPPLIEEDPNNKSASHADDPGPTPPPSPHSKKRQHGNSVSNSRKTSKEESSHSRKSSKEEKQDRKDERASRKISKEEKGSSPAEAPRAAPPSQVKQEEAPKPHKTPEPAPNKPPPPQASPLTPVAPGNGVGQLHTQYHSYYVKTPTRGPMPRDPEPEEDEEPSQLTIARMAPPPQKSFRSSTPEPTPSGEPGKLRKQDSLKPKSLAETKRASREAAECSGEETVTKKEELVCNRCLRED